MSKRNWPDHIAVGREIGLSEGDTTVQVRVVDVKCGPMMVDTSDLSGSDLPIAGTLKLKVKPVNGGAERWLPPTDGKALVEWCESQDAEAAP